MNLLHALRLDHSTAPAPAISMVGAGGKTTALFQLAREYLAAKNKEKNKKVLVSASTHLGVWQTSNTDHHVIFKDAHSLNKDLNSLNGMILITGEIREDKTQPLDDIALYWLYENAKAQNAPLLIEADGSRQHSLKAPAEHEPPIPEFTDVVIHLTGLVVIGKMLNDENVHRAEIFSEHSGLSIGQPVTPESIIAMLGHPQGGWKNIPSSARRIAFLNQADSPALQSIGGSMANELLGKFDSVIVGSLKEGTFQTIEHTAGVILAAGSSTRYGSPKQLLDWHGKPFVRHIAETALQAGLRPVVVVTGAHHAEIESSLKDLPVKVTHNPDHAQGQSTSIKAGLRELPQNIGGCIFLLADQPQIPVEVLRALIETHSRELPAILAPLVLEERRANPVLFDRAAFPELFNLEGDIGGRAIFSNYKVEYLPWHDDRLLFDVDKPEDYKRLVEDETL
jgi:molybdenum cofactor cytidylyltransferase